MRTPPDWIAELNVGDTVIVSPGGYGSSSIGTVERITPGGMIDVRTRPSGPPTRFNPDGDRRGDSSRGGWGGTTRLTPATPERIAEIRHGKLLADAASLKRPELAKVSEATLKQLVKEARA